MADATEEESEDVIVTGHRPAKDEKYIFDQWFGSAYRNPAQWAGFAPPEPPSLPPAPLPPAPPKVPAPAPAPAPLPDLDDFTVTAPRVPVPRSWNPLIWLLTPIVSGPRELDEPQLPPIANVAPPPKIPAPTLESPRVPTIENPDVQEPLPQLDDFYVSPPARPPGAPIGNDPIMPPNWGDLLEPGIWKPGQPFFPIFDPGPGSATDFPGTTGMPGDDIFPADEPEPRSPGDRRTRDPAPDVYSSPWGLPGADPIGDPILETFSPGSPGRLPFERPNPTQRPIPDPVTPADPFTDPFTDTPGVPATPTPTTPRAPTAPNPFVDPETPLDLSPFTPYVEPTMPEFQPQIPKDDACQCTKTKKKKTKKKPRAICYRGTYIEKSKSLSKKRLEQVPCT